MGRRQRRQFTKEFKTRVALDALKEMSTLATHTPWVRGARRQVRCPSQSNQPATRMQGGWKREAKESLPEVFGSRKAADDAAHEDEVSRLYEEIGRLKVELDWLKKSHTTSPHPP